MPQSVLEQYEMEKCYVPRAFFPAGKALKNTPAGLFLFPICRNNKILLKQIYKRFGVSVSLGLSDRLGGRLSVFVFSARLGVVPYDEHRGGVKYFTMLYTLYFFFSNTKQYAFIFFYAFFYHL